MYINIKLPTGGFIHLGNLICVLTICFSTLIFIPVQKALSGKFADIIGPSIDDIVITGKSRIDNKELIDNIEKKKNS